MSLRSDRVHVVRRMSEPEAKRFLGIVNPALQALAGAAGIVCREDRHGDGLYDVRVPVYPEVAEAIYRLICQRGCGREDVTEEAVWDYLKESADVSRGPERVGPLPDR